MSRRRSTGDLVPRDVTEILAREARSQRGKKKPGSSLGQAFSWLKGSRRKKSQSNGLSRTVTGGTDTKLGLQNQDPAKAGPKGNEEQKRLAVHYTSSQHQQENVFIEGSRPQYLEDLHTEAQEGLKILQQEEHKTGGNFTDDESISSADTLRPEQDISSKDGGSSTESRATAGNTDTTVTSSVSTRPVLNRQGSTFKPLNPVKRLDKSRKRSRRTTIMGIPNQVQKELALHRSSTFQPLVPVHLPNHEGQVTDSQSGVVIIPTLDGSNMAANKEGARVHLSDLETSKDELLFRKHLQAMYQDEHPLNTQGFGSNLPTSALRPKSLAVPHMSNFSSFCPSAMLSFLQESQGPVMSISPQATYLSTIIPNAILPASVEVIEIDRSISRARCSSVHHGGSVCTASKSSLASRESSVSPLLSRRSEGDGFQTDHSCNDSTQMPSLTPGSNWSESHSSKTIISNSSPISSKGSPRSDNFQRVSRNGQHLGGDQDHVSLCSTVSGISSTNSKCLSLVTVQGSESDVSGSVTAGEDTKNKRNCIRSLSVMKTKQPPAPPQRTNSLHSNKMRSSSRFLVESEDLNDSVTGEVETATENIGAKEKIKLVSVASGTPTTVSNSTGSSSPDVSPSPLSPTQASSKEVEGPLEPQSESRSSSPQKAPSEIGKFERTMSPSSGYSSQSGTPTLSPKGITPSSPDKQKKPIKPERSMSRASSSAASPSSSLTSLSSGTSEPVHPDASTSTQNIPQLETSPKATSNELTPNYNSSNLRVEFSELLNIPPPPKVRAPCPPPPETWVHNKQTFALLCGSYSSVSKDTHKPPKIPNNTMKQGGAQNDTRKEMGVLAEKQTAVVVPVLEQSESEVKPETLSATDPKEKDECPGAGTEGVEKIAAVQRQEQSSSPAVKSSKNQKKDPPPVMKKPTTILQREELLSTEQSVERQQKEMSSTPIEVNLAADILATSLQNGIMDVAEKSGSDIDRNEVPSVQTLSVEVPKVNKVSPPHTPPPPYPPTPPPSRKSPPPSVSMSPGELQKVQEENQAVESCWPPPPPPLEGDSVFEGGDEVDFPPPPPLFVTDAPDAMDSCVKKLDVLNESALAAEEVGVTNTDSSKDGTSVQGEDSDLPAAVSQSEGEDTKPEVVVQLSKAICVEDTSCPPVQDSSSVSDHAPAPPVEAPPSPPIKRAESALSAVVPSSSFPKQDSFKIGDQPSFGPVLSGHSTVTVPVAPPLPVENITHGVNFRRQPSVANRDTRSKELLSRHKSAPIPKEDANIPLVTPSLLQMVRLRSVNMNEDQVNTFSEDNQTNQGAPVKESCPVSIPGHTPQKPIRKSLSLKSPPQTVKTPPGTLNSPSMRLQEAIRMKTAAMSSRDCLPSRLAVRSPTYSCVSEPGAVSVKPPEGGDINMSPASTASFIFSRSTKRVVIDTAASTSSEAQTGLKQSLAAELMQVSEQSRAVTCSNGGVKCDKVPPPVAKKPAHGGIMPAQHNPACSGRIEFSVEGHGANRGVQQTSGITPPETTTTRVTADTIETLF